MEATNFKDDIPSISGDKFKDHYVLVFDLTSLRDATETFRYPELNPEPFSLEPSFTFSLEHVTGINVWVNECLRLQLTCLVLLEKLSNINNVYLWQLINHNPLLKYRCRVSLPSDNVPASDSDTSANSSTQPSKMQVDHWIMIANSRHKRYFADFLGQPSFSRQQCEQMMSQPLQYHPSICGFYAIYAAFHLFRFRQEEITGVHDVNVLSVISN